MRNPICWWFGCNPDYGYPCELAPSYVVPCTRCGAPDTDYSDRIGDTRHNRAVQWAMWWLWRKWIPARCSDCGRRFGKHEHCEDLPF